MKKIIILIITFLILIILYGFYLNPKQLTTKNYTIESSKITNSFNDFKIVQFSDLLLGTTTSTDTLDKVVKLINEEKPDLIVFTGDLIYEYYEPLEEEIKKIKEDLKKLDCTLYKYAVIGDNDLKKLDLYKEIMNESDFIILDNKSTPLFYQNQYPIKIIGLSNLDNYEELFNDNENLNPSLNLVLTHYPDYSNELSSKNADLILSGHSLGGQIKLPFFGGIMKKNLAQIYINDYYTINNTNIYISNGLGTETINFRLFNSPSINIYTLKNVDN